MGSTIIVQFQGSDLTAIINDTGTLVPLKPIVTGMGLDWSAQYRRVKRDLVLGPAIAMTATGSDPAAVSLPLDLVPGFLFKVDARRVGKAVQPKVLDYQRECFRVLADACLGTERAAMPAEILPPAPIATTDAKLCLRLVTECRSTFGVQPARELWFSLNLPRTAAMMASPRQGDLFTYRREA